MNLKLAMIAGGVLFATPAFAQDTPPAEGTVEAGAGAEVSTDPAATTTDPAATATVETGMGMSWSRIHIERPYVRAKGKIAAYLNYSIAKISFPSFDPMMPPTSITFDGLGVGGAYSVTDKIAAGLQYGFGTGLIGDNDFAIGEGSLGLFGMFQLMHDAKLSVAATADFTMDLCGGRDAMGDCVSAKAIHAGLGARFALGPQMAVFTGAPYGPGPVGQHLSISLETDGPITFALPAGFMYQATPELNVNASTSLGVISISNSESAFIGADFIQLGVGANYSVNPNIDVTLDFLLPDLKEAQFDLFFIGLGARWYN